MTALKLSLAQRVGIYLQFLRENRKLSIAKVAVQSRTSIKKLSSIEKGEISDLGLNKLERIAHALGRKSVLGIIKSSEVIPPLEKIEEDACCLIHDIQTQYKP